MRVIFVGDNPLTGEPSSVSTPLNHVVARYSHKMKQRDRFLEGKAAPHIPGNDGAAEGEAGAALRSRLRGTLTVTVPDDTVNARSGL